MKKLLTSILIICMIFSLSSFTFADPGLTAPEEYQITVTSKGGIFDFGDVSVQFLNGFLGKDAAPITFTVYLYSENGTPYIEFTPDVEKFVKDVHINVKRSTRTFYDIITKDTIKIHLDSYHFKVEHFSRYSIVTDC